MARKTITISVPDTVHRYIEERVAEAGFGSVSDYFRNLVREDRQRQLNRTNGDAHFARRMEASPTASYRPLASAARRQK